MSLNRERCDGCGRAYPVSKDREARRVCYWCGERETLDAKNLPGSLLQRAKDATLAVGLAERAVGLCRAAEDRISGSFMAAELAGQPGCNSWEVQRAHGKTMFWVRRLRERRADAVMAARRYAAFCQGELA